MRVLGVVGRYSASYDCESTSNLVVGLDLVVSLDSLGICGRVRGVISLRGRRHLLVLTVLLGLRTLGLVARGAADGAVSGTPRAAD